MGKEKTENLVSEFIGRYFTQGEMEEFNSYFLRQNDLGDDGSLDSAAEMADKWRINKRVDELITFAEKKLDNNNYLSFLLYLGTLTISGGDMEAALGIYQKVIKEANSNRNLIDLQANSFLSIGEVYSRQAKWQESFRNIRKAAALFKSDRNNRGLARCENLMGTIYGDMGNIAKAKEHFEKSLQLVSGENDLALSGLIEINLGIMNVILENYEPALHYFRRSLSTFQQTGDYKRIAEVHYNCGMLYFKTFDYIIALEEFNKSIALAEDYEFLSLLAIGYLSKAQIYLKQQDNAMALAFADRSMGISYRINDRLSVADIYKIKGIIQRNLNNFTAAENYLLTSLRINKELSNKMNYAETSYELGILYRMTGREDEGAEYINSAKDYYKKIKAHKELEKLDLAAK